MTKSQHTPTGDNPQNQNNAMSDDPEDGNRESFTTGRDGKNPAEKPPEQDEHNKATVEEFGREGLGVAAKE